MLQCAQVGLDDMYGARRTLEYPLQEVEGMWSDEKLRKILTEICKLMLYCYANDAMKILFKIDQINL